MEEGGEIETSLGGAACTFRREKMEGEIVGWRSHICMLSGGYPGKGDVNFFSPLFRLLLSQRI